MKRFIIIFFVFLVGLIFWFVVFHKYVPSKQYKKMKIGTIDFGRNAYLIDSAHGIIYLYKLNERKVGNKQK